MRKEEEGPPIIAPKDGDVGMGNKVSDAPRQWEDDLSLEETVQKSLHRVLLRLGNPFCLQQPHLITQ